MKLAPIGRMLVFACLAVAVLAIPGQALAEAVLKAPPPSNNLIDFTALIQSAAPIVVDALWAILLIIVTYATHLVRKHTGIQIERSHVEALERIAKARILKSISDLGPVTVSTESKIVADVSNYMIQSAPDAIKKLGLDEKRIRDFVITRIDKRNGTYIDTTPN